MGHKVTHYRRRGAGCPQGAGKQLCGRARTDMHTPPYSAPGVGPEHPGTDASVCGLSVRTGSKRPSDLAKYLKTSPLSLQEDGSIFLPHTRCGSFKLHLLSLLISDYTGSQAGITFLPGARRMINEISVCGTDGAWYFCHRAADHDSCNPFFSPPACK